MLAESDFSEEVARAKEYIFVGIVSLLPKVAITIFCFSISQNLGYSFTAAGNNFRLIPWLPAADLAISLYAVVAVLLHP